MSDYTPRGDGKAGGWVRVGRYDPPARRRALWARMTEHEGPCGDWERPGIEAVELCAGREGDDAFVRVTPENPIFEDLLDCINRAIGAAVLADEHEEGEDRDRYCDACNDNKVNGACTARVLPTNT